MSAPRLHEFITELDCLRARDEYHIAEVAELKAKLTEAERLNAVALEALKEICDGPTDLAAYHYGIRCGIEDRGLQRDPYSSCEYGYDEGLEYCAVIANTAIKEIERVKK